MNYLKYWKLERSPFQLSRTSSRAFFDQGTVEEAIARIHFLIQSRRRLGTVVGESGVGKSRILKEFCSSVAYASKLPSDCRIYYLSSAGWSVDRFYRWVSNTIGERTDGCDFYQSAMDSISGGVALHGHLVLVVDDCEQATLDLLKALQNLSGCASRLTLLLALSFATKDSPPQPISRDFQLGQAETASKRAVLAGLANQSQLRIELPAWGLGQTADYFSMMLESAGGRSSIFEAQAITRIHELAEGLVKRMNQIADLSLVAAAARKFSRVPSELIDQICEELGLVSGSGDFNSSQNERFGTARFAVGTKF